MKKSFSESMQLIAVDTFSDLVSTVFDGEKNAACWQRNLEGDFAEIVAKLLLKENITEVFAEDLLTLSLSENGNKARKIILQDMQSLVNFGAQPSLNLLKSYERDDVFDFIATDVYSFHVDRSPFGSDTFLCTYFGAASDILPNHQAIQKILIPEIRQKLKGLHLGPDEDFEAFLTENYFDLHYEPLPNANPINLGLGNLWRLSVDHPDQKTPPCIHRAPMENLGELRLLLIC